MSVVDKAHAEGLKIWKKSRRDGWLDEHLRGNTRGKKASKEAFLSGYVMGVFHQLQESQYGREESLIKDATRNEEGKIQFGNQPNLSGKNYQGEI